MNRNNALKKYALLGGVLLFLPLFGLVLFGILGDHEFNTLPYFTKEGPVEGRIPGVQQVGSFNLINQDGAPFSSDSLKGKVWLAAFFSTDAPHVASVTKQLLWPNFRYRSEEDIVTVCFTLDASTDQPAVLKPYVAENTRYNDQPGKWQFLTGDQAAIDELIADDFMIQRDEEEPNNIATIWLVDSEGYLRGVYHAASEDDIRDAVEDIALLQKEMDEAAYAREKAVELFEEVDPLPFLGPEGHVVPPFAFTNLDGREFSHRDVGRRLRVVDYFFTHCPTICPVMSSQLVRLQTKMRKEGITEDDVLLLSHTVDPVRDSTQRLLSYAQQIGADTSQWKFLTGDEEDLYDLARTGYYLTALASDTAAGGFFHSDTFVLVDEAGRIRGYYDGTATTEVDQLLSDMKQLLASNTRR
jgi:protein SCO1/2